MPIRLARSSVNTVGTPMDEARISRTEVPASEAGWSQEEKQPECQDVLSEIVSL